MSKGLNQQRFASDFLFPTAILGCVLSIAIGNYIAIILFLSICGSLVLLPNRNPLLYWPVGLALSITALYGAYVALWLLNLGGLNATRANFILLTLTAMYLVSWLVRRSLQKLEWKSDYHPAISLFMLTIVIGLLVFAIQRTINAPELLVADHLAGGDHGIHIQYINGLVQGNALAYTSPISVQSYPKGIHFVIALLYVIREANSQYSEIVNVHIVASLFEYIQLAAFSQLMLLIILRQKQKLLVMQVVFVISCLMLFLSIPKLINHLFWSGFTTSLALTWIFLLPFAFPWSTTTTRLGDFRWWRLYFWSGLSVLVWIVYQPYVIITSALFFSELIWALKQFLSRKRKIDKPKFSLSLVLGLAPLVTFVLPLVMLLVLGQESESIKRLTLFGVSWKLDQFLLFATIEATLVVILLAVFFLTSNQSAMSDGLIYVSIVAFTFSFAIIAAITSDFTLTNQPYYVQKMYWLLFFLGFTVGVKWLLTLIITATAARNRWRLMSLTFLLPGVALVPLFAMGINPNEALDRISIKWFAKGLFVDVADIKPYNAAAFHTWENLGAHVGNIALMQNTSTFLPIDIAQSRNAYWACSTMRKTGVNVIYTASGQGTELLNAGCSQFVTYIEDDKRFERLIPATAPMVVNADIPLRERRRGQRFLVSGFPQSYERGAWANGFYSTIQMISTLTTESASARFKVNDYGPITRQLTVEIVIDGVVTRTQLIEPNSKEIILSLPSIKKGSLISFQFVCQRDETEVMNAATDSEQLKCLSLESFRIRTRG